MSLDLNKADSGSGQKTDFGRLEDGSYHARIVNVIDIGEQHQSDWQTQKPKYHVLDENGRWAKKGDQWEFTTEPNDAPDIKPQVLISRIL